MKCLNLSKRWKYFAKSPAIVSLEKLFHGVFIDPRDPVRFHTKIRPINSIIPSELKTKKMKGGYT
jgi:hypothetical protein